MLQQQQHRPTSNPAGGTIAPGRRNNASFQQQQHNNVAPQQKRQQPQPQHDHSSSSNTNNTNIISSSNALVAPSPLLFERLVTEEAAELKTYSRIIESQNRRLADLEVSHDDLERRLEMETQKRILVQQDLDRQNLEWQQKYETLEKDRDLWKHLVNAERAKNERLLDQVMRKDREIHRMIQRKVCMCVWVSLCEQYILSFFFLTTLFMSSSSRTMFSNNGSMMLKEVSIPIIRAYLIMHLWVLSIGILQIIKHQMVLLIKRWYIKVHMNYLQPKDQGRLFVNIMLQVHYKTFSDFEYLQQM
jgi:hypothetical protein